MFNILEAKLTYPIYVNYNFVAYFWNVSPNYGSNFN